MHVTIQHTKQIEFRIPVITLLRTLCMYFRYIIRSREYPIRYLFVQVPQYVMDYAHIAYTGGGITYAGLCHM